MKKIISILMALLMLALVGCNKTPETNPSTTADSESTTEKFTHLSYDEYFSEVRSFEEPEFTNFIYWEEIDEDRSIFSGKYLKYYEYDYKDYEGYDEIQDDKLYITVINRDSEKNEIKLFTDYEVHNFNTTGYDDGAFQITEDGVYTVINRNEVALLDLDGKILKSFYKSTDAQIKALLVKDDLLWFLCGDTIYRVYMSEGKVDELYKGVDFDGFHKFLAPISNHEIEWLEINVTGESLYKSEIACYFDSKNEKYITKEYIPDSQPQEILYPVLEWWNTEDEHFK